MPDTPWYRDSLSFTCTQCGQCCTGDPGYVWVTKKEIEALARFRGLDLDEFAKRYVRQVGRRYSLKEKANYDCVFYDRKKGCTVYPVRPPQCRTWPFWESNVETPEDWKRTCETCPGSGRGELIPAEEISRRLKVIKM